MWLSMLLGGFVGSIAYPALAVYRSEMFPTGNRGRAAGLLTAMALLGGIAGLLAAGGLLDADWPYGRVMGMLALAQVVVDRRRAHVVPRDRPPHVWRSSTRSITHRPPTR